MKDVARLAGVSTSTVSHVINKDRFVSEAITAKVEAAIKELNYAPSALARSLKLNQTHTIGMLITASTNPFYSELVRGVERSCFERGYSLVLCNTEGDEQRMNRNLETLMQKRVDGLLLLCTETHQPSREIMQRYPTIPTVMMDWAPFDGDSDLIQDNSFLGGFSDAISDRQRLYPYCLYYRRWIKRLHVCGWKVTGRQWIVLDWKFLMAMK